MMLASRCLSVRAPLETQFAGLQLRCSVKPTAVRLSFQRNQKSFTLGVVAKQHAVNADVVPGETESDDSVIRRFRSKVREAGVIDELRRRKVFESTQDKIKRKAKASAKRRKTANKQAQASGSWMYGTYSFEQPKRRPNKFNKQGGEGGGGGDRGGGGGGGPVDEDDASDNWSDPAEATVATV